MSDALTKDARIDKVITWTLMTAATLALSIGAWFFRGLDTRLGELGRSLDDLKREVAVLQVQRHEVQDLKDDAKEFRARLRALEAKVGR